MAPPLHTIVDDHGERAPRSNRSSIFVETSPPSGNMGNVLLKRRVPSKDEQDSNDPLLKKQLMVTIDHHHHDDDSTTQDLTSSSSSHCLSKSSSSSSLMVVDSLPPPPRPPLSLLTTTAPGTPVSPLGMTNSKYKSRLFSQISWRKIVSYFSSSHKQSNQQQQQVLKLCFGACGVYACYLAYGHIQEELYRYQDANGVKFTHVWYLQVLECLVNIGVGLLGRRLCGGRQPTSYWPFFTSGASQVFAKVLTSLSLAAGLSFPVCVLAKSAKVVPVMMGQLCLGGSRYSVREFGLAGAIVVGTSLLSMSKKHDASKWSTPAGVIFIVMSLVMDGVTGGLQKRLKRDTRQRPPTTYDFLLFTNVSMCAVALTIALLVGDLTRGFAYMQANPILAQMIWMECLLSAMGQSFIFYVVAQFDPMVCATITTTRKILSVLWSIVVKGHVVNAQGSIGLCLAITGILLGLADKLQGDKKEQSNDLPTPADTPTKMPPQKEVDSNDMC